MLKKKKSANANYARFLRMIGVKNRITHLRMIDATSGQATASQKQPGKSDSQHELSLEILPSGFVCQAKWLFRLY
jgi:hypothetical protein